MPSTSEHSENDAREQLKRAMYATLEAGSARVRYTMHANPPELADYDFGDGVADFRQRKAHIAYSRTDHSIGELGRTELVEQVIDRGVTYLRLEEPAGAWIKLDIGAEEEFPRAGDASGFLDLLKAPGSVVLLATSDHRNDYRAHYRLEIDPPRSSLRDRLSASLGVKSPSRLWLDVWTDGQGHVRRIATFDHAPTSDGTLPRGAVCTTVDYSELGVAAPVVIPPA